MWSSRNKNDLIIEVWEKLDCENVGACEIVAIEDAVREQFGKQALDSPMMIARLLADEGAELRHSEIMRLFVERHSDRPYDAAFRNILRLDDLKSTLATIRDLENLRNKFAAENDAEGLRLVAETARRGRLEAVARSEDKRGNIEEHSQHAEIAEWLAIWLQSPEIFENWIALRRNAKEFIEKFGKGEE